MNREIKFRAWTGTYMKEIQDMFGIMHGYDKWSEYAEDKDFVLMQFTGLLDKNGKEIYEGDILDLETTTRHGAKITGYHPRVVEWMPLKMRFRLNKGYDNKEDLGWASDKHLKMNQYTIIGNIYENPELLTNNN